MNWQVITAKDGEASLKLNDILLYSSYRPKEDAKRWVDTHFETDVQTYFLIGLGLGYHLEALSARTDKEIIVYYFEDAELQLFQEYQQSKWWQKNNIKILHRIDEALNAEDMQILVTNSLLKALGETHPLFAVLDIIKINQRSYKHSAAIMRDNFIANLALEDNSIQEKKVSANKIACLVSAGPSLDETIEWLKTANAEVDIFCVGAALAMLLKHKIIPTAVVISDAGSRVEKQFENVHYTGDLYYLSTARTQVVNEHRGPRYILLQNGYRLAEDMAKEKHYPLIETGGSVATTTFSLLETIGYCTIILFGQDLAYYGDNSHAQEATSVTMNRSALNRTIVANNGEEVKTTASLYTFWYWFEQHVSKSAVRVYNTAQQGAKITGAPLINQQQFHDIISQSL